MDYLLYFMGLISVAILSSGLTFMYCATRVLERKGRPRREPHQWYWWVGTDPEVNKEYVLAAVGKNAPEAQMKLSPRNLNLSMNARLSGNFKGQRGRHVLVARSLSEINVVYSDPGAERAPGQYHKIVISPVHRGST